MWNFSGLPKAFFKEFWSEKTEIYLILITIHLFGGDFGGFGTILRILRYFLSWRFLKKIMLRFCLISKHFESTHKYQKKWILWNSSKNYHLVPVLLPVLQCGRGAVLTSLRTGADVNFESAQHFFQWIGP